MYDEMNGVQVLWHLLTNWEEGKGLYFIMAFAMIAISFSIWSVKHLDNEYKAKPDEYNYWM